jgi:hypothetical protein
MTPEEYASRVEQTIIQHCPFAENIRTKWDPDTDRFGFWHSTTVLLHGGGSLVVSEHLRYRRERPCRQIGSGLHIVRFGYTLVRRSGEFTRFDYDPHRHKEIPGAPFHKHVNDREAVQIEAGDPRTLGAFLVWATAQIKSDMRQRS